MTIRQSHYDEVIDGSAAFCENEMMAAMHPVQAGSTLLFVFYSSTSLVPDETGSSNGKYSSGQPSSIHGVAYFLTTTLPQRTPQMLQHQCRRPRNNGPRLKPLSHVGALVRSCRPVHYRVGAIWANSDCENPQRLHYTRPMNADAQACTR